MTAAKSMLKLPLITIIFMSIVISACTAPTSTEKPATPTGMILETPTASLEVARPLPTREAIPEGLIQIPVPDSAVLTAANLSNAERPPLDRIQLAKEFMGLTEEELIPQIPQETKYQLHDRIEFIFRKNLGAVTAPPDYQPIKARLRHISDNAYWWTSLNATFANDQAIRAAAENFEEEILPINRLIFGKEWSPGIDGDHRIHILMVQEVEWGSFYGVFSPINEYPKSISPISNEKEMFIVNLGAVRLDSVDFAAELSHEMHHLIHWNQDPNEDYWFTEVTSELAKFLVGKPSSKNVRLFAEDPTIQLTAWPERSGSIPHYGAVWLFSIYLLEQFGPEFIKEIVKNPAPGVIAVQEELAKLPDAPSFEEIYANWIVANLLNMPNIYEGQFGYREITPDNIIYQPVQQFNGEPLIESLPPYAAQYYLVNRDEPIQVSFNGSTLARLTPADPYAGEYVWYSNRGDESEFTLTRTFDLSDLDSATLEYQTWYEFENFLDFAYLETSTDGGKTWEILETNYGTDQDPIGRSLGFSYTGSSVDWLPETIDLTPYAGKEIQLRFHVVTDFATSRDGFQIDEISIPELGYYDGAEDDSGGWDARGFVRSSNFVPAEWIVWLITAGIGNPPQVYRIEVNADQSAEFEIPGLGTEYPRAALIVSPTAPITTLKLDYELSFLQP